MEVIIGFIVSLVKIGVLSSIYSFILILIINLFKKYYPNSWFKSISSKRIWFLSGITFSTGLLIYLFSYWGFHGFGDGPRIPIGYDVIVDNTNWDEYGYIHVVKTKDNMKIEMTKFKVDKENLIGNLESGFYDYKNAYFIYDMNNKNLLEFKSKNDYEVYAKKNKLPLTDKLRTFEENYNEYWNGWRTCFLP